MILDEIAEKTRARVEEDKKQIPFFHMRNEAERLAAELPKGNRPKLFPFYQTLKSPGISFICGEEGVSVEGCDRRGIPVSGDREGV